MKAAPKSLNSQNELCTVQKHMSLLASLAPGESKRCPTCRQLLQQKPVWKCSHGAVDIGCELCRDTLSYDDAELTRTVLQMERERP